MASRCAVNFALWSWEIHRQNNSIVASITEKIISMQKLLKKDAEKNVFVLNVINKGKRVIASFKK